MKTGESALTPLRETGTFEGIKMKRIFLPLALVGLATASPAATATKPNIILILAGDLGYGDVGVFFQNSRGANQPRFSTPQIDRMAAEGRLLSQHYTGSPVCAPARASLLLGLHQGNCPIRDNQFDKAMPDNHTLATVLKQADYRTVAIGKWGLQGKEQDQWPGHPLRHGFDEFFGFLEHKSGHTYYHDAEHPLRDGWENVTDKYQNIYSTDLFTAYAKKFIVDHEATASPKPFFMYLAYTAIHNPLNVPGERYPDGDGLKGGLQWPLKAIPATRNAWLHPDYANATCNGKPWSDAMKRYATMARRLDDGVGDLLQLLRDLHLDRNTLVVFTSDNGPANEAGSDPRLFDSWGPFDGFKRDCWEGGIHEPAVAWWPGRIPANSKSDFLSGFWDWMPTFADFAGLVPPAQADGVSLIPALTGKGTQRSRGYLYGEYFVNQNNDASADVFARKGVTGRGQQQFVRVGKWAGVRTQIKNAGDPIRLYDIEQDPHQDHNVAGDPQNALVVLQMTDLLVTTRRPNSSAPRPYDNALLPSVPIKTTTDGMVDFAVYEGNWPWMPDYDALTPVRTGHVAGLDLSVLTRDTNVGVKFSGFIEVPGDGNYTFYLTSDAGAEMWIHDAHLINDEFRHSDAEASASILLKAGRHPFRLFYRHTTGKPLLKLEYSVPGAASLPISTFSRK